MRYLVIVALLFLSNCAYHVKPPVSKAVNIYSSYEEKIPGKFILIIDDDIRNINREIATSSYACSAHKYPVIVGDSLAISIKLTMEMIFEKIEQRSTFPPNEVLRQSGFNGTILVSMDTFQPRITCSMGFWSGSCMSNTDLAVGVEVKGIGKKLYGTSVGATGFAQGGAGTSCEGGSKILSESISKAVKDTMEKLGERVSNSKRIRDYLTGQQLTLKNHDIKSRQ